MVEEEAYGRSAEKEINSAIAEFQRRDRRYGGVKT